MTEKETQEFLKAVEGKKIRRTHWNKEEWVIVEPFRNDLVKVIKSKDGFRVGFVMSLSNGFIPDAYNIYWEFFDEEDTLNYSATKMKEEKLKEEETISKKLLELKKRLETEGKELEKIEFKDSQIDLYFRMKRSLKYINIEIDIDK